MWADEVQETYVHEDSGLNSSTDFFSKDELTMNSWIILSFLLMIWKLMIEGIQQVFLNESHSCPLTCPFFGAVRQFGITFASLSWISTVAEAAQIKMQVPSPRYFHASVVGENPVGHATLQRGGLVEESTLPGVNSTCERMFLVEFLPYLVDSGDYELNYPVLWGIVRFLRM